MKGGPAKEGGDIAVLKDLDECDLPDGEKEEQKGPTEIK